MRYILLTLIFAFTTYTAAKSQCPEKFSSVRVPGALIAPGATVVVHTDSGDIKIEAIGARRRRYSWKGGNHTVTLREMSHDKNYEPTELYNAQWYPRPLTQWYPYSLGLVQNIFNSHGMVHGLSSESTINFPNEKEALNWLFIEPGAIPYVWRKDGLCAWYHKQEHVVSIDLYQIYINGSKPTNFPGGTAASINLYDYKIPETTSAKMSVRDYAKEFGKPLEKYLNSINPSAEDLINAAHCQVVVGDCDAALATLDRAERLDSKVRYLEQVKAKALHRKMIQQKYHAE